MKNKLLKKCRFVVIVVLIVVHVVVVVVFLSLGQTNYRESSSGRMISIRLKARIYTQTNYKTNYRSLPKFVPDG